MIYNEKSSKLFLKNLPISIFFILDGPSIVQEETYHHVQLGQTVTLTCKIFANPPPKVSFVFLINKKGCFQHGIQPYKQNQILGLVKL